MGKGRDRRKRRQKKDKKIAAKRYIGVDFGTGDSQSYMVVGQAGSEPHIIPESECSAEKCKGCSLAIRGCPGWEAVHEKSISVEQLQ